MYVLVILFSFHFSTYSFAADGFKGYAVYRDGAILENWHTGIMSNSHPKKNNPVIHAGEGGNTNNTVRYGKWDSFVPGSKNFKGFYCPNSGIPDLYVNSIVSVAYAMTLENILYTPLKQLDYTSTNNMFVHPGEITHSRCDGVVEYSYELNDIRIYGNDDYWDISKRGSQNKKHHSGIKITPKKQASVYMTRWEPKNKVVYMVNQQTGKGLDVCGPSASDGAIIQQWEYLGASNQKFLVNYSLNGNYYSFIPLNALGSAVEVQNNLNLTGTEIQIWTRPIGGFLDSQKFRLEENSKGAYKFLSYGSNYEKVLRVSSDSSDNGIPIKLWNDTGSKYQFWFLIPA